MMMAALLRLGLLIVSWLRRRLWRHAAPGKLTVVPQAIVRIGKDAVCFQYFTEPRLRGRIAGIAIRVVLHGELPEGGFHMCRRRIFRDAQDLV